jgi:hypothetical protein
MMDFKTPAPDRYRQPVPQHRPVATVPPPTPPPEPAKDQPKHRRRLKKPVGNRNWKKMAVAVIIIGLIIWLTYGYITTKNQLQQAKNSPATAGQTETQKLINKVGQLVDLPSGETPTIATVNDASKLKNQAFFASAQNGDKVLIYAKAGKAVLYRPSSNRVVEYSKVNLNNSSTQ